MNKIKGFNNYFLCKKTWKIFRLRNGVYKPLKLVSDRATPTYALYNKGEKTLLTLEEIVQERI